MDPSEIPLAHELERGMLAYEAYRRASAGVSYETGVKLIDWKELDPEIQRIWIEVANDTAARARGLML